MDGLLLLPVTAFMSFASILWLVVAKLATAGNEDEASSSTASANNDDDDTEAVTVSSSGNIISAKTITSKFTLNFLQYKIAQCFSQGT